MYVLSLFLKNVLTLIRRSNDLKTQRNNAVPFHLCSKSIKCRPNIPKLSSLKGKLFVLFPPREAHSSGQGGDNKPNEIVLLGRTKKPRVENPFGRSKGRKTTCTTHPHSQMENVSQSERVWRRRKLGKKSA